MNNKIIAITFGLSLAVTLLTMSTTDMVIAHKSDTKSSTSSPDASSSTSSSPSSPPQPATLPNPTVTRTSPNQNCHLTGGTTCDTGTAGQQPQQPMTLPNPKPKICVKDNCIGPLPLPKPTTQHHTKDYKIGFKFGKADASVGIFDPVGSCGVPQHVVNHLYIHLVILQYAIR